MNEQTKVTGVILAGGLARRMGNQDKGLIQFKGKPMIEYALSSMESVVDYVLINANRNILEYEKFGFPVIADRTDSFDGPLAGVLTAMKACETPILLVMPCDSPLVSGRHLQKLLDTLHSEQADISVAFDGERLHPVFLALRTGLASSLEQFLSGGGRKIDLWLNQCHVVRADFSNKPEIFRNINTLKELLELEVD